MNKLSQTFNLIKAQEPKQMQKQSAHQLAAQSSNAQSSLNTLSKDTVNFTGLNRNLSKTAYYSIDAIKTEVKNFPKSNGIVGNLPAEWVQKIPKENRANTIKELYGDFKTIISDFRTNAIASKETSKKLTEAFTKAGIIQKGETIDLSYINCGRYGSAYRLKGLSDDKHIIKVFTPQTIANNAHGQHVEPSRAAFWQKNAGRNTQMVPFYFGDVDAGYMVNKYIDESTTKFKKYIIPESLGLKVLDADKKSQTGDNVINWFQIDYGGIKISENSLMRNKVKQQDFRKFLALSEEKQLETLDKADDTIKLHILEGLCARPGKERYPYFKQILKNPSEELKLKLANKIYGLPAGEHVPVFEQLNKDASDKVRCKLASVIHSLPIENRLECFQLLFKDASEPVKKNLVYAVNHIPFENKAECYILLAKNSGQEVNDKIMQFLEYMPKEEGEKLKKLLAEPQSPGFFTSILNKFGQKRD